LNRARYSSKDFFTVVDDLVARIQVLFVTEFNDFVTSGTGQMLIDIVAWAAETLSFYIDRQATESYIVTARTRKGVVRLARQLGYKVSGAVAASVDLDVNLGAIQALDTTVPVGFQWKGPNDLVFETIEEVIFPATEGPISPPRKVGVRQGTTRIETFTSTGARSQVFRLSPGRSNTIAAGSVSCRVNGADWSESEIITFDATDQYETGIGDDPPTIRFGNGVAGNVPPVGAEIRVEYFATAGSAGLVMAGTISEPTSPLVIGATVVPLLATNQDPSSGGADQESLDQIKANAPRLFRAHTVAITRDDYESLAGAYIDPLAGAVAVAQAFVARSADDDLQLQILLDNIRGIASGLIGNVTAETAAIALDISNPNDLPLDLNDLRTEAETAATDATTSVTSAGTSIDSAKTGGQGIKNKAGQIGVDAVDIQGIAANGKTEADASLSAIQGFVISGKAAVVASSATAGEKDAIEGFFDQIDVEAADENMAVNGSFDQINSEALNISGDASIVQADIGTVISQLDIARDGIDEASAQLTTISLNMAAMTPLLNDIAARVLVIDGLMATSFGTAIETELQAIFDHVDGFLAADCQANLITVPILTRDADGFLTAPPIALLRSLQTYLDARKEVTQDPEVVSGERFLVEAVISGTIGVLPGYVQPTVLSNVRKAVDDLLRIRAFGASLRISDLDRAVAGIAGVKYSIFRIEGPPDHLDGDGNLIIASKEVITKESVTVVSQAAAA